MASRDNNFIPVKNQTREAIKTKKLIEKVMQKYNNNISRTETDYVLRTNNNNLNQQ